MLPMHSPICPVPLCATAGAACHRTDTPRPRATVRPFIGNANSDEKPIPPYLLWPFWGAVGGGGARELGGKRY